MLPSSTVNRTIVAALIIILTGIILYASRDFQGAFLGAILIFTLFLPVRNYLVEKRNISTSAASLISILLSLFTVIFPLFILGSILTNSIVNFLNQNTETIRNLPTWFSDQLLNNKDAVDKEFFGTSFRQVVEMSNISLSSALENSTKFATSFLSSTAGAVTKGLVDIVIMYFILYYLLRDKEIVKKGLTALSPFNKSNTREIINEFKGITYSSVLGMFAVAISQGLAIYIGMLLLNIFLKTDIATPGIFALLTGICSLIPVVGAVVVWIPLSLYIVLSGSPIAGIIFALYCMFVVSNIDNIIRAKINEKVGKVHPLVSIIGLVIGVPMFGVVGIVLGPLLISFLLLFIKMFKKEFVKFSSKKEEEEEIKVVDSALNIANNINK